MLGYRCPSICHMSHISEEFLDKTPWSLQAPGCKTHRAGTCSSTADEGKAFHRISNILVCVTKWPGPPGSPGHIRPLIQSMGRQSRGPGCVEGIRASQLTVFRVLGHCHFRNLMSQFLIINPRRFLIGFLRGHPMPLTRILLYYRWDLCQAPGFRALPPDSEIITRIPQPVHLSGP